MPKSKNKSKIDKTPEDVNVEYFFTLKLSDKMSAEKKKKLKRHCENDALLHCLVKHQDLEGVKVLIEVVGVKVDIINCTNTPLIMCVASHDNLEIFQYLLQKGANLKFRDGTGLSAFCRAVWNNRISIVKYLVTEKVKGNLDFDANLMNKNSKFKWTPLVMNHFILGRRSHFISQ